ncbi:efflux RND transporter periplasmic adaptor subunit [Phenylobacterium aquaticum]|uniref:efflux RND transporter periplasmic adaptor subunit n=1 Tax=Phenylobacterium aquaticum TaxID=1763816 RepID=UPI001F5C30E4|nr:efflux RND transporter periplasmic adaptor subunit [Phenylobacterium aquaticum]MCI3131593.1 efflux RND transporter periplasmic adaptor subunit [Phenylobacterium aquaticum]
MKLTQRKTVLIAAGVVAALVVGLLIKTLLFPAPPKNPFITAPATIGSVEQTVMATGTLEPVTLVSVGAQVSGQLTTLNVELGQTVKKGQLIGQIDSQPQENALHTAEAQLANVRAQREEAAANLVQAEAAYRRQAQMLAADATAKADYDTAEAGFKSARGQLAALDAQITSASVSVRTAQVNLGYTRIVSPIDGTVVAIVTKQGQTVNANQSAPTIVKVGQLGTMTVQAEISEADVIKVHPGQEVYFTVLGDPDRRYTARLRAVEPAPESLATDTTSSSSSSSSSSSTAIYYDGLFDIPNTDGRLRTSMTANVNIVLARVDNVLTIPSAALNGKSRGGRYQVQVIGENGKPEPRTVTIGVNNNAVAQVLSGLKAGDKVVVAQAAAGAAPAAQSNGGRRGPPSPMGF